MAHRDRIELQGLLLKAVRQRERIKELQTELELLNQKIARVEARTRVRPERRRAPRKK